MFAVHLYNAWLGIWGTMVLCWSKHLKQWKHLFLKYFCHHHVTILLDRTAVALAGNLLLCTCIISVGPMTSICSYISGHRHWHTDCIMFPILWTLLGRAPYQRRYTPALLGRQGSCSGFLGPDSCCRRLALREHTGLRCEWLNLSFE